jgi:hypothetical protein
MGSSLYGSVSCIPSKLLGELLDRTGARAFAKLDIGSLRGVVYIVEILVALVRLLWGAGVVLTGRGVLGMVGSGSGSRNWCCG